MSKTDEIHKADRQRIDSEIRLNTIRISVDVIDREISILSIREIELKENLNYLKNSKIITLAAEYRKIKEELLTVQRRIKILIVERESRTRDFLSTQQVARQAVALYEHLTAPPKNNVLSFGRKDDRRRK